MTELVASGFRSHEVVVDWLGLQSTECSAGAGRFASMMVHSHVCWPEA